MFSARFAAALLCAASFAACDRVADPTTGPAPSMNVFPEVGEFLPGIAVLDPFAIQQVDGGVIQSARGGGHFHIGTELRTFSFNAKTKSDGTTQGQFQLNNRAQNAKEHGDVTCLSIVGNEAFVGGIITHSNIGSEGFSRVWRVVDNGEGQSNPDLISLAFSFGLAGTEQVCLARPPVIAPLFPIESGNLQVRGEQ